MAGPRNTGAYFRVFVKRRSFVSNGEKMKKYILLAAVCGFSFFTGGCAGLNSRLTNDEDNVRLSALEDIKNLDEKGKAVTAESLKEYLNNPNSSVRNRAAEALLKLGAPASVPVFISALEDKGQIVRVLAEEYLVKFEDKAIPLLLKALQSPDKFTRTHAAYALGSISPSTPEVSKKLFSILGDENKSICAAARDAIIKIGLVDTEDVLASLKSLNERLVFGASFIAGKKKIADSRIVEILLENLMYPNIMIRNASELALVEIGGDSKEALGQMLAKFKSGNLDMQAQLIIIFGNIGSPAASTLPEIFAALKQENELLATLAAETLPKIDARSETILNELITMTGSQNIQKRLAAVTALGKLRVDYKKIAGVLVNAFSDNTIFVRDAAVKSFTSVVFFYKEAANLLDPLLSSADKRVRAAAVKVVTGIFGVVPNDYTATLVNLLNDPEFTVRIAAAEAVGNLGLKGTVAVPALVKLLADTETGVQFIAKDSLEKLGILSGLTAKQMIPFINDANLHISKGTRNVLVRIGQKSIAPLIEALREKDNKIKATVAYVLGKIGIERGSPMMREASDNLIALLKGTDSEVRTAAATALGDIGIEYKESIIALTEALRDPDENVRAAAVESLGKIGPGSKSAAPFIAQALKDKSNKVAGKAKETIILLGNEAVPYLREILKDENSQVRSDALDALKRIGSSDALEELKNYKAKNK